MILMCPRSFSGFIVNTPQQAIPCVCAVSTFCCFLCFCSPRDHCWSGGPYHLFQVKTNCCRKRELPVQTAAVPDSLRLEKPYPFFMPWLWHLTNCANRISQEGANPCCLAWNKPRHESEPHIIKCSGEISLFGVKGLEWGMRLPQECKSSTAPLCWFSKEEGKRSWLMR